jgi:hypothetical protein
MIRIATAVVTAIAVISGPAFAQQRGRSVTAPGTTGATPGQSKPPGESAKAFAPGQNGGLPPPGSVQSQTTSPGKAVGKNN